MSNKGRAPRNLSEATIRDAMKHTKSNTQAARYLNLTIDTYRKYAKLYIDQETGKTLYELHDNRAGKGIPKLNWKQEIPMEKLEQILSRDEYKAFNPQKLKARLLYEGKLKLECYRCKHNEKRVIDYKQPLVLNYKDGNKHNWRMENLEMICYNCHFLYIGGLFNDKQLRRIEDITAPTVKSAEIDYKLDDDFLQHFRDIGLMDNDDYQPGDEFITRI